MSCDAVKMIVVKAMILLLLTLVATIKLTSHYIVVKAIKASDGFTAPACGRVILFYYA